MECCREHRRTTAEKYARPCLLGVFFMVTVLGFKPAYSAEIPTNHSRFEAVKIKKGTERAAAYFDGKSTKAVVFVPGAIFNKESWFFLAKRLQQLNIASLSLDGKGEEEVLSAVRFLKEKGFTQVVLVGASMGGAAVLHALDEKTDSRIEKVIVLAPAGGAPIKSRRINKLFVIARNDRLGIYQRVKKTYIESANPKEFVEYEGSEHAQHLFKGVHKEELSKLLISFIGARQ